MNSRFYKMCCFLVINCVTGRIMQQDRQSRARANMYLVIPLAKALYLCKHLEDTITVAAT